MKVQNDIVEKSLEEALSHLDRAYVREQTGSDVIAPLRAAADCLLRATAQLSIRVKSLEDARPDGGWQVVAALGIICAAVTSSLWLGYFFFRN